METDNQLFPGISNQSVYAAWNPPLVLWNCLHVSLNYQKYYPINISDLGQNQG